MTKPLRMTKKVREVLDLAINEGRLFRALRWSDANDEDLAPDVPPPTRWRAGGDAQGRAYSQGWAFSVHNDRVARGWSTSNTKGGGEPGRGGSQGALPLHSTKLKALRGLRRAVERECAKRLAAIDKRISEAEGEDIRLPNSLGGTMDGGAMADGGVPAFVTVYTTDDEIGNIPLGSRVRVSVVEGP